MTDAVLYVLLGLFVLGLSVWGAIVSVKSLPDDGGKLIHFWGIIACGIIAFLLTVVVGIRGYIAQKEAEHQQQQLTDNVNTLHAELQADQVTNVGKLEHLAGKLEESEQLNGKYAPAIQKLAEVSEKLAETSATYTRKTYEEKAISDHDLYTFTMSVVKKLREFSAHYAAIDQQQTDEAERMLSTKLTDAERAAKWEENIQKSVNLDRMRDQEFRASMLPDVLYAKQELAKRKLAEPQMSEEQRQIVNGVFRGGFAGPDPDLAVADYLEVMVKPLSPK